MTQKLTAEELRDNWEDFRGFFTEDLFGDRYKPIHNMLDTLEDRLILTPASAKRDFHNAFPGGLVEHSLRVIRNSLKYAKAFGWLNTSVKIDSIILAAAFHDLGKLGDELNDYYVPQTDGWRVEKLGEVYEYNRKLQYTTVPLRGVYLCQHFGVKLTHDEMLAIILNDGFVLEENKKFCLKEPLLAHIIMTADYVSTLQEKRGEV